MQEPMYWVLLVIVAQGVTGWTIGPASQTLEDAGKPRDDNREACRRACSFLDTHFLPTVPSWDSLFAGRI